MTLDEVPQESRLYEDAGPKEFERGPAVMLWQ